MSGQVTVLIITIMTMLIIMIIIVMIMIILITIISYSLSHEELVKTTDRAFCACSKVPRMLIMMSLIIFSDIH